MNSYLLIGFILSIVYSVLWIKSLVVEKFFGISMMSLWNYHKSIIIFTGFGYNDIIIRILLSFMVSLYMIGVWPWLLIGWGLYSFEY